MRPKNTLFSAIAIGFLAAPVLMPVAAQAATRVQYAPTIISVSGRAVSQPRHVVANDPWSGKSTSWLPVYYLQQTLNSMGVQTSWNGSTLRISSTPKAWEIDTNYSGQGRSLPAAEMQFAVGATTLRAPKLVANDPASGTATTYVPVYYAQLFLHRNLAVGVNWVGGQDWQLAPPLTGTISATTYATSAAASQEIDRIQSSTYITFAGPTNQTVDLGNGITAKWEGGLGHAGLQWHEGNWTVEVLYFSGYAGEQTAKDVVTYLHTHMLPPPKGKGIIILNDTNFKSAAPQWTNTIAWQEGSKLYQYAAHNGPLAALQAVVNSQNG